MVMSMMSPTLRCGVELASLALGGLRRCNSLKPIQHSRRIFFPSGLADQPMAVAGKFLERRVVTITLRYMAHRRRRIDAVAAADKAKHRAAYAARIHSACVFCTECPLHALERGKT